MKKKPVIFTLVAIVVLAIICAAAFLYERSKVALIIDDEAVWDLRDSLSAASQMKVVILQDGTAARFISEDESTYTCEIQDSFSVLKEEARVELWSASDGKGIVYLKEPGYRPSYSDPDLASTIVLDLIYEEGCVPETYSCLGFEDGWYKINLGKSPAYIEAQYVFWDAIDSF